MVFSNKKELLKKIYNRIESIISLLLTGSAKDSNFIIEDFILMKEGTLSTIEKIWDFRTNSKIPLSFTLDAGANVHLLYPKDYQQSVMNFINSDLIVFCENQQYICDEVGSGAKILNESYA